MERKVQLIILGNACVGKTTIMNRFTDNKVTESYVATLGIDYASKSYTSKDGNTYKAKIWDTAGQERFHSLTYSFYKKADGIILAYDVTDRKSFESLKVWIDSINDYANLNTPVVIVGNKIDLEDQRVVSFQEAQIIANFNKIKYMETSAKTDRGVQECVGEILEKAIASKFSSLNLYSDLGPDKKEKGMDGRKITIRSKSRKSSSKKNK